MTMHQIVTHKEPDPNFLTPSQILTAARKHVAENFGGQWPEDEWFELGNWDINLWADDQTGETFASVYPITPRGSTQTNQGITIPVQYAPAFILAELRELGRTGKINDMSRILFSDIVSEIIDGAEDSGYLDTLRKLTDQFSRALDGIERDLDKLQGRSLLANDDGTYALPANNTLVRIRAGKYDVIVTRDDNGAVGTRFEYIGEAETTKSTE